MQHKMAFQLFGLVVATHLDKWTSKAYVCNQGSTASFISRQACCILNLAKKHDINLIPTYIPTHLNVKVDFQSEEALVPE